MLKSPKPRLACHMRNNYILIACTGKAALALALALPVMNR